MMSSWKSPNNYLHFQILACMQRATAAKYGKKFHLYYIFCVCAKANVAKKARA